MDAAKTHPPSPDASPEIAALSPPTLGHNLKTINDTQHDLHEPPLPLHILDALDEKHNRHSIPLIGRLDFEKLVASFIEKSSMTVAPEDIEVALAKHLQGVTMKLQLELENTKRKVFLDVDVADEVDKLLPLVQQKTLHGWNRYIAQTLSALPQLYSTDRADQHSKPLTLTASPPMTASPPAMTRPVPTKSRSAGRAVGVQKKRRKDRTRPMRRSDRIRDIVRKG